MLAAGFLGLAAAADTPASGETDGDAAAAEAVYVEQCSVCHVVGSDAFGPDLTGIMKKPTLSSGQPLTDENLRRLILDGLGSMPRIPLDDRQLQLLVAYLETL